MMKQNYEHGNEWYGNGSDRSRYGYGFNPDPLGYNKSHEDYSSMRNFHKQQNNCADNRSNKCNPNSLNHPHSLQSNSWFDSWNLGNNENRYSLTKNLLPNHSADMTRDLQNLPSWLNSRAWNLNSFLSGHPFDDGMMISENEREYMITLAIPGCDRKDVSVNIREHDNGISYLDISWNFSRQSKSNEDHILWMGRTWGSGSRNFPIPSQCDKKSIKADMRNGSLLITMPKINRGIGGRSGRNKSINLY